MLPICPDCLGKLTQEDTQELAGEAEGAASGREVNTPVLGRDVRAGCVVLTFGSPDYAEAFRRANRRQVFPTVMACLAARPRAEA